MTESSLKPGRGIVVAGGIVAVLILVVLLGVILNRGQEDAPAGPGGLKSDAGVAPIDLKEQSVPVATAEKAPSVPQPSPGEISDPISEVLTAAPTDREAARQLLQSLSKIPADRQPELFSHVMNLLPDEDFDQVRPVLLESRTPREVLEVIYADVLNRPEAIKYPLLLELAFQSGHPLSGEAKETLELLFGDEGKDDPQIWRQKIAAELAASR